MNPQSIPESVVLPLPKSRILVVDDDGAVRRGLRAVLMMEAYDVIVAENGREAVEVFGRQGADLVLLDMNMPLQNGWSTIAGLRAIRPSLPVIFITARPDQRTLARECGVDLMEKPLDLPGLLRMVRAHVGAKPASEASAV